MPAYDSKNTFTKFKVQTEIQQVPLQVRKRALRTVRSKAEMKYDPDKIGLF